MAFFDDIIGSLTGGDILKGVSSIAGAVIGSNANSDAAEARTEANTVALDKQLAYSREGRQEMRDAADRGLASITAGTKAYTDTTAPLRIERPVMLPTNRGLTTQQEMGLGDLQRGDAARLAATGMRGSGRAGIGAVLDRDRRYIADARDGNDRTNLQAKQTARSSADAAISNLGQVQAQEGGAKANTELQVGNNIGQTLRADGTTVGQTIRDNGSIGAGADTSNAQLYTSAINSLGGIFANADASKPLNDLKTKSYGDNAPKV